MSLFFAWLLLPATSTSTLAVTTATVAPCPQPVEAVTAFPLGDELRLAVVPAGSPLLGAALSEVVEVWPLSGPMTLEEAASAVQARKLTCTSPIHLPIERLVSPVDGTPVDGTAPLYALGPERGRTDPGPEAVARLAEVIDLLTADKAEARVLPLWAEPATVPVPGGSALALRLGTPPLGELVRLHGPVVRLGVPAPEPARLLPPSSAPGLRGALDREPGDPAVGDVLTATAAGYGALRRTVVAPTAVAYEAGDVYERFFVAHGLALGLPLLSIGIGFFGTPRCVVMCEEQVFFFDRNWLQGFVQKDAEAIRGAEKRLYVLEGATFLLASLAMLAPSARHGYSNRLEILEDILILVEGSLVALTTPILFRNRIGRNRPVAFHPVIGPEVSGNDRIGPPLMAFAPNFGGGLMGAATTLLFIEDAPAAFTWATAIGLTGLSVWLTLTELEAGLAFPADGPLSFIYGAINGAGVALWHQIFWRGWPGNDRGDLPLVLSGPQLMLTPDGGRLGVGGSF